MPRIPLFTSDPAVEIDPVCNMKVSIDNPPGGSHEHEGKTYYFCGPGCRVAFAKEPAKYLSPDWEGHM